MCLTPSLSLKPREKNVDLTWEESILNLKKKSRLVSSYLFFCESVLVETVCWGVGGGEEGLQSHKPTG